MGVSDPLDVFCGAQVGEVGVPVNTMAGLRSAPGGAQTWAAPSSTAYIEADVQEALLPTTSWTPAQLAHRSGDGKN